MKLILSKNCKVHLLMILDFDSELRFTKKVDSEIRLWMISFRMMMNLLRTFRTGNLLLLNNVEEFGEDFTFFLIE